MTTFQPAPTLTVRRADEDDGPVVVDILSAAFQSDPFVRWVIPDPARRAELNPALFRVLCDRHLPLGGIDMAQATGDTGPAAAAVWVPETTAPDPDGEAAFLAASLEAAAEHADRLHLALTMLAGVHPQEPHAYLFILGTRPSRQCQGFGSALIRHVTERLDRHNIPAYLEATGESNRRLYARHGFADVGVTQLPDGPPLFRMWRHPH